MFDEFDYEDFDGNFDKEKENKDHVIVYFKNECKLLIPKEMFTKLLEQSNKEQSANTKEHASIFLKDSLLTVDLNIYIYNGENQK